MKAVVSVTFDNMLAVHDLKIIDSGNKMFVAMPSRKTPEGVFRDVVHPINHELREKLDKCILEKYFEHIKQSVSH